MNWEQIGNWFIMFLSGCSAALEIFAVTLVCAIPLGVLISFGNRSKYKAISWPVSLYISIMRGTPLLLQLFFVYFAPKYLFHINYDRMLAVLIAFVLNYAAYFAEIFRGGMDSMEIGQYEAAQALGFSRGQTFFQIILPQVIKRVVPAMANEVITLVKDTSLAYALSVEELFFMASKQSNAVGVITPLIIAGIYYYFFNLLLSVLFRFLEKKLNYYR